jgi:uncharacterized protein (DUF433 family)
MNTIQTIDLIASNPDVRDGRPFILGTTITVADIAVTKVYQMLDADEIADLFDLTLPQVYSALAYYYEYKQEIDATIAERQSLAQAMKEQRIGSRHTPLFG